jgi:hypothetical protein
MLVIAGFQQNFMKKITFLLSPKKVRFSLNILRKFGIIANAIDMAV